jgi:hypothetical protein
MIKDSIAVFINTLSIIPIRGSITYRNSTYISMINIRNTCDKKELPDFSLNREKSNPLYYKEVQGD